MNTEKYNKLRHVILRLNGNIPCFTKVKDYLSISLAMLVKNITDQIFQNYIC